MTNIDPLIFNTLMDDHTPIGLLITSLNGRIIQSNQAIRDLIGLEQSDLEILSINDISYFDDANITAMHAQRLLNGEPVAVYENRYQHKNGRPVWTQVILTLQKDASGTPLYYLSQVININPLKQTQHVQLEKEADLFDIKNNLQAVLNHVPAMIAYWDKNLINQFGNKAYEEWFGISAAQMQGKHIRAVIGESLYQLNLPYLQAVLSGETQSFERIITDVSGRERYTMSSYIPDVVDKNVNGFFVLVTDVTSLKRAEQRISQSEAMLQAMYDNLPFLAWMKDTEHHYLHVNKHWLTSAGISEAAQIVGKNDYDFWPSKLAAHYQSIDKQVMQNRQQTRLVEKSINKGIEHWVETYKTPVIDKHGQIIGTMGLARDITEEQKIEEKLKLAASIYQCSSEGMLITDANNKIIDVNPAFTNITGYLAEEVIGKDPKILHSGLNDKYFYKNMWQSITAKGCWQGEIWDRKKSGELHSKRLIINTIPDSEGKVYRHIGIFSDITEQKKTRPLFGIRPITTP